MGVTRSVGGASSALFRFVVYVFLRWIPGRFGPYLIPLFYLSHLWTTLLENRKIPRGPATPAEAALVPQNPKDRPSFADVTTQGLPASDNAVVPEHPHVVPDSPSSGSISKRNKKKKNGANRQAQLTSAGEGTDGSDSDSALVKFQKLPRNRPQPKATLSQLVRSIVFGTPTPTSSFLNYASIAVNTLLFALVMDAIWTPVFGMDETSLAFARVGAISHNQVKIVARIPPESSLVPRQSDAIAYNSTFSTVTEGLLPEDDFSGAKLAYRPTKPLGKWIAGPDVLTSEANDWVSTVKLDGLWASTEYEYRLLRPSTLQIAHHPAFPNTQYFTTFPDPSLSQPTHYTFASSSCAKPGFPWTGPQNKKSMKGADSFLKVAEKVGVKFMMFLGDFIYADVPWLSGVSAEQYNKRYRQTFASPELKKMVEKIPLLAIYDDHEIVNDFSGNKTDAHFAPANTAYKNYLGNGNPDARVIGEPVNYYDFRVGDSAFFVLDTRAYRSPNSNTDDEEKTMLGDIQLDVFMDWLHEVNQTVTWKFIVSSVPMMSLWNHAEDTWAGFLAERDLVLNTLQYVPNVIVLSGDRHEFASAGIRDAVTEFSTSPFNMFYLPIRTLAQNHGRGASGEDVLYKYIPDGNTKFTTFEVDTRTVNKPVVRVKVYVDAETADDSPAWEVQVLGKPLRRSVRETMAVGGLGMRLKELLSFLKRSWF
ncbi:hypothetical protein JCM5350_002349 [Sporobolomyces pararoseus]